MPSSFNLLDCDLVLLSTVFSRILQIIYEYQIMLVQFALRISPNPEKYSNITNGIRFRSIKDKNTKINDCNLKS